MSAADDLRPRHEQAERRFNEFHLRDYAMTLWMYLRRHGVPLEIDCAHDDFFSGDDRIPFPGGWHVLAEHGLRPLVTQFVTLACADTEEARALRRNVLALRLVDARDTGEAGLALCGGVVMYRIEPRRREAGFLSPSALEASLREIVTGA